MTCEWGDKIFTVDKTAFQALALEIFQFQYRQNAVYHSYVNALGIRPVQVDSLEKVPFLPISFFKTHKVKTGEFHAEAVFASSGTTHTGNSRHYVKDLSLYIESFTGSFERFYGKIKDYCIIGLLPSYTERQDSSLVFMVNTMIKNSNHPLSGFYPDEYAKLAATLQQLEKEGQKSLLIGVTFALLDFAEGHSLPLQNTIVMETGGMKGRREEMTREAVHDILKKTFSTEKIHSEYGMTELLSQAYSEEKGIFKTPPWMKIMIRDEEDPLHIKQTGSAGAINIIDLANVYSCSFIATDDAGRLYSDERFEVLGRLDGSDLRGCSLMVV